MRQDSGVAAAGPSIGAGAVNGQRDIRLVLADVDGTLVTQDKVLSDAAKAAARELQDAGIALAITSSRPPRGMSMLIEPLTLRSAIAGFNGGVYVDFNLAMIQCHRLDPTTAQQAVKLILHRGLDVWVYTGEEWLVRDKKAPHVAHETWTVRFDAEARSIGRRIAGSVPVRGIRLFFGTMQPQERLGCR